MSGPSPQSHKHVGVKVCQCVFRTQDRVPGSKLLMLFDKLHVKARQRVADEFLHVPHNDYDLGASCGSASIDHSTHHCPPADFVAYLGQIALHSRALASGKDYGGGLGVALWHAC